MQEARQNYKGSRRLKAQASFQSRRKFLAWQRRRFFQAFLAQAGQNIRFLQLEGRIPESCRL